MTWVKLDDNFYDNLTNRELGAAGRDLFIASLCFCAKGLTDGKIPKTDVKMLLASAQSTPKTVQKLVAKGRWIENETHYQVANYLDFNPSREKVLAERKAAAERMRARRSSGERSGERTAERSSERTGERSGVRSHVRSGTPSRPVPKTPPTPPHESGPDTVHDNNEEDGQDQEQLWQLLADRQIELDRDNGKDIINLDRYEATLIDSYRRRHALEARTLVDQNPHWDHARIADELEPNTAVRADHTGMTWEQTQAWLAERRAQPTCPMPDHMRRPKPVTP